MKHKYPLIVISGALLMVGSAVSHAAIINNVDFTTVYAGTTTPDQLTPAWTETHIHDPSAKASATPDYDGEGYMRLDTSFNTEINYFFKTPETPTPLWNHGPSGSTIEFSMRVASQISGTTYANNIYFSTGAKDYRFYISATQVTVGNIGSAFTILDVDMTEFQTFRLTITGDGSLSLYLNNSTTAAVSNYNGTSVQTTRFFYFGDAGGGGGVVDWEYVALTNQGAFAPVPEPAAVYAMAGVVLAGVLFQRRRKVVRDEG